MVFQTYNPDATIKWYDEHSADYDQKTFVQSDDNYGSDLYRLELVRQLAKQYRPKRILDVGCGTGEPMLRLLMDGFDARGFDFSPGMIAVAKRKLDEKGYGGDRADVGDILDPAIVDRYGRESFDAVVANGVLPYIAERDRPHKHLTDLVKPGGLYISAYSNALFDLVTFNRFTLRFHDENFIASLDLLDEERESLRRGTATLMTFPEKPARIEKGARNDVFIGADNPLTIGQELARFGLKQIDMVFYKFHAFPPLLNEVVPSLKKAFMRNSRAYELVKARDWRGHFLASTFIVVCRKEMSASTG